MSPLRAITPARVAYVIMGSHRSGTSALARAVNLAGLGALPTDLVPPHPVANPAGFWEPRPVIELNDSILAEAGGAWDRPPRSIAGWERHVERAASLLAHLLPQPVSFVLKDPRLSLLVPLWQEALTRTGVRPVYLLMLRHPAEVAASLAARDGFAHERGLALWMAYTLAAEVSTRGRDRLVVAFDRLLSNWPGVIGEIAAAGGCPGFLPSADAARAIDEFLSPSLKRQHGPDSSDVVRGEREQRIYELLLGTGAATREAGAELDVMGHAGVYPTTDEDSRGRPSPSPDGPIWLLVTGAPRSGTSLLRALLVGHPQIGLLQEYGLTALVGGIDAIVQRPPPTSADWDRPGISADARFNQASAFYRDRPGRDAVTRGGGDPQPEHFQGVARGLFASMFPNRNLAVVGDKMPIGSAFEDVPLLFSRLPGFRIVAVIRNPAHVVRSSLIRREATRRGRDAWPIRTVREAVAQWVVAWRTLRALKARHHAAVAIVKYEDLCARPQEMVDDIVTWLGLSPNPVSLAIGALPPDLALHTAAEQADLERLLGPLIDAWPTSDAETLMTTFARLTPPYLPGKPIRLSGDEATPYLDSGFSFREQWGRWTDGPRAALSIPHGVTRGLLLVEIRIVQAFVRENEGCDVVVRSGWGEPKLFQLGPDASRIAFVAQAEETQEPGTLTIELLIARPKRPDEPPSDSRALGILVESLTVTQLPDGGPDPTLP